ncbi:hypothetical protein CNMCM5793_005480 [Aspergillus hiratsukae]|uniref:F-box domain-containing protein n=1 Tax=Aspergillus hiratsukae TaxID=1194566 RepID=A0A8H6PGE3_9EURO|nr:hypothetical protein CNMCM5793_005480 [Aspergillus hiratsukae]
MIDMTKKLDSIPYDVFYQIASGLDCHDFINLSRVNQALNTLMQNESIARKTIENHLLHSKEGREADRTRTGYRRAVGRLFDIKEAFATAQPYSASVLAYGSAFLYSQGSLCYIYNNEIRALNVHGVGQVEQVLNVHKVVSRAIPSCNPARNTIQISLLHYRDGILAFLVEIGEVRHAWLLAVDMRRRTDCRTGRLRLRTPLQSTRRLFVRHNRSYLYYGTQSALSHYGYPQWAVHCVDLATGQHTTEKPVELHNFVGNEIGQTVCFEVHQDHLYAVSTLVDFEEEEVDWTSLYMWICLPPRGDTGSVTPSTEWRRQHREGPINDTWSDLSLREDEATNQLMVLECRREWRNGGSDNCRTYYMQPLPSPAEISRKRPANNQPCSSIAAELPDEPLTKTLDSSNKAIYERPRKRLRRHYHPEYPLDDHDSNDHDTPYQRRDFILAKTKFRTYNLSASTFVDLVNDPHPSPGGSLVPHDRLRLRTVSRKRKSPFDETNNTLHKPEFTDDDGKPLEHSEERFTSRGIHMWPPDNAPPELTQLLCPSHRIGKIQAVADERSIVYSVDQEGLCGNQAIILINFDPVIRHPGLKRLNTESDSKGVGSWGPNGNHATGIRPPRQQERTMPLQTPVSVSTTRTNQAVPSVREEPAMYLSINHGYWLR